MPNFNSATPAAASVIDTNSTACGPQEIEIAAFRQPEIIDISAERNQLEEMFSLVGRAALVPHVHTLYGAYARAVAQLSRWMETRDGRVYHDDCLKAAARARKADQKLAAAKAAELEASRARAAKVVAELDAPKIALATSAERYAAARAQLDAEEKLQAFEIINDLGDKKAHEIYVRATAARERNESVYGNWLKVMTHFVAWQQETEEGKTYTQSLAPRPQAPRPERKQGPDFRQLGMGLSRFSKKSAESESTEPTELAPAPAKKMSKADRAARDRALRSAAKTPNGGGGKKKGK